MCIYMYAIYQMVPIPMTLNDPNPDFKSTPFFDVESQTCIK